jgi:hypothetical protein
MTRPQTSPLGEVGGVFLLKRIDDRRPPRSKGIAAAAHRRHICGVPRRPSPPKKPTAAKLRSWRVAIMRLRAKPIGTVQAPDVQPPRRRR